MQTRDFSDLKPGYQVVYADPPWLYYGDPNKDQAAGKHYQMMSPEELRALPVKDILAKKAVVLMWTTSSKMAEAIELLKAWGCFYRGVFQVWVKTSKSGNIIHGQGARPSFTKPTAEYLLVGSTQAKGKTLPIFSEKMPNVVLSERPENVHSRKPAVFRSNIEELFGEVQRVELFAREAPAGWDAWGNEVPLKTLKLKAKK